MPSKVQKAIIKAICYSDVFNYPLTLEEIWKLLIKAKSQKSKVKSTIKNSKLIKEKEGYYFLPGREKIVRIRKKRAIWSEEKLKIAKRVAFILKLIPTIKLVGVTGALALNNAHEDDDIDLLVITSGGLLWATRLLATILVELTGKRRRPRDIYVNNKICLNMFIDEKHLEIQKKEQNIFTAHEVLQMKPIWERDSVYQKYLLANNWVIEYLPNALNIKYQISNIKNTDQISNIVLSFLISICSFAFCILHFAFIETVLEKFQLWYMRDRRTTEVIKEGIIRFHPQDAREWVMKKYRQNLAKFNMS